MFSEEPVFDHEEGGSTKGPPLKEDHDEGPPVPDDRTKLVHKNNDGTTPASTSEKDGASTIILNIETMRMIGYINLVITIAIGYLLTALFVDYCWIFVDWPFG